MVALNAYSPLDRFVHRIAFASPGIQLAASDMEDSLFGRDVAPVTMGAPIFVTSLPRAGTTILLTALASVPGLATHLYRDMPFVMAPLLWSRLSGRFRKPATLQERAHGDGIAVGYDSPEAFEEVIWRAFWPDHFDADGIDLWTAVDARAEARDFMARHFRKVVALRCRGAARAGRYISKNNGNIARLDLLPALFPEATILVPVRRPLDHAASLHRQHMNFLKRHAEDPFTRRYMADIGHYEFGRLHRPIRFEGLDVLLEGLTPGDLDYWLAYWIAAFEHVRAQRTRVHLIAFEDLGRRGPAVAARLCAWLDLDPALASGIGAHFRPAPAPPPAVQAHRSALRDRAEALYGGLIADAVCRR